MQKIQTNRKCIKSFCWRSWIIVATKKVKLKWCKKYKNKDDWDNVFFAEEKTFKKGNKKKKKIDEKRRKNYQVNANIQK